MKANVFEKLKEKLTELNGINDKINFIEWNAEEGPRFDSIEEMKDFEEKVINGDFEFLFEDDTNNNTENSMIETFEYTLEDYFFFIYTFKRDNDFITYMTIKNLENNYVMDHLYGNKSSDKEMAHSYFENLKSDITSNNIDYIFENILIDVNNNIEKLKIKYNKLANQS